MTEEKRASTPARPVIVAIHGPNLNLLGAREPHIYGRTTLGQIDDDLRTHGQELGVVVETFQSNHEGALIDRVQQANGNAAGLIVNAGDDPHQRVIARCRRRHQGSHDRIHLSILYMREEFRHRWLAPVCLGQIAGLGAIGYRLALDALARLVLGQRPGEGASPGSSYSFHSKSRVATSFKKGAAKK